MDAWEHTRAELEGRPRLWLVTGAAGFIGSHILEELLGLGQRVRGLDDLSTGSLLNLEDVRRRVGEEAWGRFELFEDDVCDAAACARACAGVERVLHQAALGSVPRSIAEPARSHAVNVDGFLNMLLAARAAGCARFVYASSSSVYGDHPGLPKCEPEIGEPLSPYAATKRIDELYAATLARVYELEAVGLRYFNVFGPRQDPAGAYAAVIPRWIGALLSGERPVVNGDGETSRDFCPVQDAVQANLLAATVRTSAAHAVYNVALGQRTTLNELLRGIRTGLARRGYPTEELEPVHGDFRPGDVRHSLADLERARAGLGYIPLVDFEAGLTATLDWFAARAAADGGA